MDRHLVSTPVSGFHVGDCTDGEPAHFWSKVPFVNGVRSWQLIIKHDLTHWFHGRTLDVHLSFRALTDVEPGHCGRHQVSDHGTDVSNHVL